MASFSCLLCGFGSGKPQFGFPQLLHQHIKILACLPSPFHWHTIAALSILLRNLHPSGEETVIPSEVASWHRDSRVPWSLLTSRPSSGQGRIGGIGRHTGWNGSLQMPACHNSESPGKKASEKFIQSRSPCGRVCVRGSWLSFGLTYCGWHHSRQGTLK